MHQLNPSGVTKAELDQRKSSTGRSGKQKKYVFWEGDHPETGRVWVTRRKDRHGIACLLTDKGAMACMVSSKAFDTDDQEAAMVRSERLMQQVGEAYIAQKVELDNMYSLRNQLLGVKKKLKS